MFYVVGSKFCVIICLAKNDVKIHRVICVIKLMKSLIRQREKGLKEAKRLFHYPRQEGASCPSHCEVGSNLGQMREDGGKMI